ncbi:MAG: hypothetical protein AB7S75_06240 [Desulfococcaceae bacterium]
MSFPPYQYQKSHCPDIVVSILHKNLDDFEKFASSSIPYLKDRQKG